MDGRLDWPTNGLERPVPAPRCPLLHPRFENFFVPLRQLLLLIARRHHQILVVSEDPLDELAFVRVASNEDLAAVSFCKDTRLNVKPQFGLALVRVGAVAREAGVGQNRPHVPVEVDCVLRRHLVCQHEAKKGCHETDRADHLDSLRLC